MTLVCPFILHIKKLRGIDICLSVVEMHCSFGFKNFLTLRENAL